MADLAAGSKILTGAAWVVALRVAVRLLSFVSILVLARLLTPADFGLVALSALLVAALEAMSAFNFDVWLIRHEAPDSQDYNSVWTLSLLRGVILAVMLCLIAQPAANFFDEPRLVSIVQVIAVATALAGLTNVGIIEFQKAMHFRQEFSLFLSTRLVSFAVTVGLALSLRSYWALVAGLVAQKVVLLFMSYWVHAYRPRFSLTKAGEVMHFSKWLLIGNLFGFAYVRLDRFILGKLLSTQALGLYAMAQELAHLASSEIVAPLRRVLLPAYAELQNEAQTLTDSFLQGFAVIVLVGLPIALGVGLVAGPLVQILLGAQWLAAIPLVEILSFYGALAVMMANQGPVLLAIGHTRQLTALYCLGVVLLVPAVVWGISVNGVPGAAWGATLTNACMLLVTLAVTLRALRLPFGQLLNQTWRSLFAVFLMYGVVRLCQEVWLNGEALWLQLVLSILIGMLSYGGAVVILWLLCRQPLGAEQLLIDFIQRIIRRGVQSGRA